MSRGMNRMILEDATFTLGKILFLYVTIPLMVMWILIGYFLGNMSEDVVIAISGPAYFFFPMFAIAGYKTMIPVAVGLGGTRKDFLKSFYVISLFAVTVVVVILNVLQLILKESYRLMDLPNTILHPAVFFNMEYNFFSYVLVDLMFGIFLFCISFLFFAIYFRLGFRVSIIILMGLFILGTTLYYIGLIGLDSFEWLINHNLNDYVVFAIVILVSLLALMITYPILKNSRLRAKTKYE
ncbi:hypothetical protein [Halalkalibacillus halophilus]|uniref:hypothetical protein n=1 Tax=Halalkalibacillus halophilus TaxID=392827 RepID=UPI0004123B53|nr:hypothetical protein [Halalkalibacillus halophilus]